MFAPSSFRFSPPTTNVRKLGRYGLPQSSLRKLLVECLEDRRVLSTLGGQFQVDPSLSFEESAPAVAVVIETGLKDKVEDALLGGKPYFVAAWQSWEEDGSGFGIQARAYDPEGQPIGDTTPINIAWLGNQQAPTIATNGKGNFIVAWQAENEMAGGYDVVFRAGRLEFVDDVLSMSLDESETIIGPGIAPAAAMARDGRSVITWTSLSPVTGYDIQAAVVTTEGIETLALADQEGDQLAPTVASDTKDDFVIAWTGPTEIVATSEDGEEEQAVAVFGRGLTLDQAGTPELTSTFLVSGTTSHDVTSPSAAMNAMGSIAVAWQVEGQAGSGSDIFLTVFGDTADALSSNPLIAPQLVNDVTRRPQRAPAVGLDKSGNALVAWQSQHVDGYSWGILGKHYQIKNTGKPGSPPTVATSADFLINETERGPEMLPSVAMLRSGQALVGWLGPEVPDHGHGVEEGEGGHEPAVFARWTDYLKTRGPIKDYGVSGSEMVLTNYAAVEDNGTAAAMDDRGISLVAWESWQEPADTSSNGIYAAVVLPGAENPISVPLGLINGDDLGNQSSPGVAVARSDAVGNTPFVIVWQSDHAVWNEPDASHTLGYGIYGLVGSFDASGTITNSLFITVSETLGNEVAPAVAMDEEGQFVVVWQATDVDGQGIQALNFDANGDPLTSEPFPVNFYTSFDQVSPTVAMNEDGQFVVAWVSDHNVLNNPEDTEKSIFARWYADALAEPPPEFLINEYTKDAQEHPDVAMDEAGNFIVVWQSINQEAPKVEEEPPVVPGVSWGVYGRRYIVEPMDNGGFAVAPQDSTEFLVNDTLERPQRFASVGMDHEGNFAIAWQSIGQDGSSWGIYAKEYPATYDPANDSAAIEFLVNTHTMGPQIMPVVARSNLSNAIDSYGIYWSGQGPGHTEGVFGRLAFDTAPPVSVDTPAVDLVFGLPEIEMLSVSLDWLDEPWHSFKGGGGIPKIRK